MRSIDIKITKARLESFSVELPNEKGLPSFTAKLGLYTEKEKKVSEYTLSTHSWYGNENTVTIPDEIHHPLSEVIEILERVAYRKCNGEMSVLESPKQRKSRESKPEPKTPEKPEPSFDEIPF